jgi:hypothetical protein
MTISIQVQLFGKGNLIIGIAGNYCILKVYSRYPAYPTPFNPVTHIKYAVPKLSKVRSEIYNIPGQRVQTFLNEEKPPGIYAAEFDASHPASSVYFYRLETADCVGTRKMVLLR